MTTGAAAYFCPTCGSPALDGLPGTVIVPGEGAATCRSCKWTGPHSEVLVHRFVHDFANNEQVVHTMMRDLRGLLAKAFMPSFGTFLLKWGFLSVPVQAPQLTRYLVAVAKATLEAVFAERERQEKERANARLRD